jgi:hypothetical protein
MIGKIVGELNLIDTSNLERFEVLEYEGGQRLVKPEGLDLDPTLFLSQDKVACRWSDKAARRWSGRFRDLLHPPEVIWRGWATDPLTALDAAQG